jgi:hypothetical protein
MELEVKHLAPYLPYKLRVLKSIDNNNKIQESLLRSIDSECKTINYGFGFYKVQPLLKPLSFFKFKEIGEVREFLGLGKWCDAYDEFFDSWFKYPSGVQELVIQCNYEVLQYFFANHYDVFDLIENNLATKIEK